MTAVGARVLPRRKPCRPAVGEVVNTTGRIASLCRTLDSHFLVSADLCGRLDCLPSGAAARRLGAHALTGRGRSIDVLAIERHAGVPAEAAA